jgi:hypothetical protein
MIWAKKVIKENLKEIFSSASAYVIFLLVFLIWNFILDIKFEWQQIEALSAPSFFVRAFYSAFTFLTLGRALYYLYFYKFLHDVIVKTFGSWKLYNLIKYAVWVFLMFVSYQYIVPWLFGVLNGIISLLYNIAGLALYVFPLVGISLVATIIYLLLKERYKHI